jgi:hypothetical protein
MLLVSIPRVVAFSKKKKKTGITTFLVILKLMNTDHAINSKNEHKW